MSTVTDRVEYGVEWLNANVTDWWERVDLDTLNLEDPEACVLGQVFTADAATTGIATGYLFSQTFFSEHGGLLGESSDWEYWAEWTNDAGFSALGENDYELLNANWREAIINVRAMVS